MKKILLGVILLLLLSFSTLIYFHFHHHARVYHRPHSYKHLAKYKHLKDSNPDSALNSLTKYAKHIFQGQKNYAEWAQLVAKMDRGEKALLTDMLVLQRLQLEIEIDIGYSQEWMNITKQDIDSTERFIEELKAEGKDPNTYRVPFHCRELNPLIW